MNEKANLKKIMREEWRGIVVRTPVLAGELSLSCARLMADVGV